MPKPLSDRESFENSYYYFVEAVRALAAPLNEQRQIYGSTIPGIAWELKADVSAGSYLINSSSCHLPQPQREAILALVAQLRIIPEGADLHHPLWDTLRPHASRLLEILQPFTQANAAYLYK